MNIIQQYLNTLPEPYRSQALENYDPSFYKHSLELVKSHSYALSAAFKWSKSKHGEDYWCIVCDKLVAGEITCSPLPTVEPEKVIVSNPLMISENFKSEPSYTDTLLKQKNETILNLEQRIIVLESQLRLCKIELEAANNLNQIKTT